MNRIARTSTGVSTQADCAAFARDGVVCVRGVFPSEVVARMLALWDEVMLDLGKHGLETTERSRRRGIVGSYSVQCPSRQVPALRRALLESAIAATVGNLLGCSSVGFYFDQIFAKAPMKAARTPWHNDAPGHAVRGEQIVGVWIPLTPVNADNGLECIGGSHLFPERYWPTTPNGDMLTPPPGLSRCPDFEARRDDPTLRFLNWTMAQGDVLITHPRTLHFSCGNRTTNHRRIALATWWHGDDVVWDLRPESEPPPLGIDPATVRSGVRPEGPECPIVWRAA